MYDYLLIGAGSAGCVLAHHLTEDPETSVLVLASIMPTIVNANTNAATIMIAEKGANLLCS